jgi:hypothetical protein
MPAFHFLRHPVGVMCVLMFAFIAWVWHDAVTPRVAALERPEVLPVQLEASLAPPPEVQFQPTPPEIAQAIPKLRTGLTRAEVEGIIGTPAPTNIHPAIVSATRGTYFMCYEVELEPDAAELPAQPKPRTLVTLEFDAHKHGHPLRAIHGPRL